MKQETNDTVIKIITEWEEYTVNLNWDVDCSTMVHHFASLLRGMEYTTCSIIDSLRNEACHLEDDVRVAYKSNNLIEEEDLDNDTAN